MGLTPRRPRVLAAVAGLLLAATACASGEPSGEGTASPSPTAAGTVSTPHAVRRMPAGYEYLCDLVPADQVSRASGIEQLEVEPVTSALAQLPARDLCSYVSPTDARLTVGVSVLPGTTEALAAARASQPYLQAVEIPDLGDAAYFLPQAGTVVALTHGRIITVTYQGAQVSRDELVATAELLAAHVPEVEPAPRMVTLPACDKLVDEVEAVLGEPVQARRDLRKDASFNCGFATVDTFVSAGHTEGPGQAKLLREYFNSLPGVEKLPGIGKAAYYSHGQAGVVLSERATAGVQIEPAPSELTPELKALIEATASL